MRARLFGAAALFLLTAAAVRAEPIPPQNLAADQRTCTATCTSQGFAAGYCTQYCACTFQQVAQKFTLQEYNAAREATRRNQDPPKPLIDRMVAISDACVNGLN